MPRKDEEQYLPSSRKIEDVYQVAIRNNFKLGTSAEQIRRQSFANEAMVSKATRDYLLTGATYFARRGQDDYLCEVGRALSFSIENETTNPLYTNDVMTTAAELRAPQSLIATGISKLDEPHVAFRLEPFPNAEGVLIPQLIAYILTPPDFLIRAQRKPIEALATTAWLGSQIRDAMNGRIESGEAIHTRANATEAHFLQYMLSARPSLKLPEYYQHIVEDFPQGIYSLPQELQYVGNYPLPQQNDLKA